MQTLVVGDFGTYLGKKGQRALVRRSDGTEEEYPLLRLSEIIVAKRGVAVSSDLIAEAVQRGVRITFLDGRGEPYALLSSPFLTATVATRRAQMAALGDERGMSFARILVEGKLHNQAGLLKYLAKNLRERDPGRYEEVWERVRAIERERMQVKEVQGADLSEVRPTLLGIEGRAGKHYWEGVKTLLGDKFSGREHRGAEDPVNAMLNYGYGILYSKVWAALLQAGLEPFAGFLHTDRPGKPSLVLDCVEEFRQAVVDRTVIALVQKRVRMRMDDRFLAPKARRTLAGKVLERLEAEVPFEGKKYKLGSVIQLQARHLAAFLRGERGYRPYKFRW